MGERKFRYHMLALAVVLVWGVTFVCTKVLIAAGLHPVDIFWIRYVLAYAGIWLYIVLVASLACFIGWNLVIDKLGNVSSTNYVYLNPVFTLLTATLFLGERMTPLSAVGCAAILDGVIWAGSGKTD